MADIPNNVEAEQATLGSILLNREALISVAPWLRPSMFYLTNHAWIYEAMLACYARREPPDTRLVADELRRHAFTDGPHKHRLDGVGGVAYLSDLVDQVATSYHVEHYAREVERVAVLRGLITAGGKIAALGYDTSRDAADALGDAQAVLGGLGLGSSDALFQPLSQTVDAFYSKIDRVQRGEATALGLPMGWRDLDEITGGLHADELTIIAARPAVGKTSFMLSLAYNLADATDADVLIASLEMNREQLLLRLIAMDTRIDTHRLRTLHLGETELSAVMSSMGRLSSARVFLADISALTPADIRMGCLKHIAAHDRPVVPMIDYLQLMGSTRARENRVQDVSEISRSCKNLARELHAPVIALSQLSRAVESRQDHVPLLSDLRESGSLEQDADNVWMLYREELYDKESDKKGIAELHVAKHRQGPLGVVPMRFDAATTRFDTLTYREPDWYCR